MSTAVILGAGFSRYAGLPTQSEFFDLLLHPELSQNPLQKCITAVLEEFLGDAFGWAAGAPLPSLEEFFTCVDLSANSGHHLGIKYTPKLLRAIRRMTMHRVLQILDRRTQASPMIDGFLKILQEKQPGFVVLNWDIVLERGLQDLGSSPINYGFDCFDWHTGQPSTALRDGTLVGKINGSSNWAYCDNCASMFYDLDRKLALHDMVGLVKADFRLFDESITDKHFDEALGVDPRQRACRFCNNMISTHMATFSFTKSYRTFAYPAIWHSARRLLSQASEWIFVGYSMPDADYEFKHLLKASQLALGRRKAHAPAAIHVVTGPDGRAERRFRGFFGKLVTAFYQGLEAFIERWQLESRL
ncbi:MAG: hypothetical protein AB7K24_27680 [Gemmataceae bacterium]